MNKKDKIQIETARKYGLNPGTLKCYAFTLFDEEYSPIEVRFLLRHYAGKNGRNILANTVRKYHQIWKLKQAR
jgi:hypothetical protein